MTIFDTSSPHGRLPPADFSLATQPPLELGQHLDTGAAESMVGPEATLGTGTAETGIQPERHFTDETLVDRPYEPQGKWLSHPVSAPANL